MSFPDFSFGNRVKRRRKALDLNQQERTQRSWRSPSLVFKIASDDCPSSSSRDQPASVSLNDVSI